MTLYDGDAMRPKRYLVSPPTITCTMSELLCDVGVTQLACSETQKYGHVTYFWNGNRADYFDRKLETYIEVPSFAPPFDEKPRMRADAITDTVLAELAKGKHRFLRLNFANGDMVGHTGNFKATCASVEAVDQNLKRLEEAVLAQGGALLVTADHGNADEMAEREKKTGAISYDASGVMIPRTSHSLNPVPWYVLLPGGQSGRYRLANPPAPGIGNVAATLLMLLGFSPPADYLPSLLSL
jgi:2,3-bisphosphoglycerate-independent phosphoglycerate mutase